MDLLNHALAIISTHFRTIALTIWRTLWFPMGIFQLSMGEMEQSKEKLMEDSFVQKDAGWEQRKFETGLPKIFNITQLLH